MDDSRVARSARMIKGVSVSEFIKVAQLSEVQPGTGKVVHVGDKAIGLFNVDGNIHAIDNACLHRGGPLTEGELQGEVVRCPWHGWEFNVKTGICQANPTVQAPVFEVRMEGSDILIAV